MDILEIVKMCNDEGMNLQKIGEMMGISKSTVQRKLVKSGWHYDRKSGKYINKNNIVSDTTNKTNDENSIKNDTVSKDIQGDNTASETINIVNRTYGIPEDIDRALKIKAAVEGKKVIDIIRDILKQNIERKYFDM